MDQEENLPSLQITDLEQLSRAFNSGLIPHYQEIFAAPPYYELFGEDEVKAKFTQYVTRGLLFLAYLDQRVAGFGAAMPFRDSEIAPLESEMGLKNLDKAWYMADLGVKKDARRKGLARHLVQVRLDKLGQGTAVIMRTSVQNQASQSLYSSMGFHRLSYIQHVSQLRVPKLNESTIEEIDERIFMFKLL